MQTNSYMQCLQRYLSPARQFHDKQTMSSGLHNDDDDRHHKTIYPQPTIYEFEHIYAIRTWLVSNFLYTALPAAAAYREPQIFASGRRRRRHLMLHFHFLVSLVLMQGVNALDLAHAARRLSRIREFSAAPCCVVIARHCTSRRPNSYVVDVTHTHKHIYCAMCNIMAKRMCYKLRRPTEHDRPVHLARNFAFGLGLVKVCLRAILHV